MFLKLFLAFTLIPVIEIYLLIKLGGVIGPLNTVIIVIITGLTGAHLARIQGMQTMLRIRSCVQQGITPAEELVDAMLIFVAGVVLLTPGFLTDAAGLLLLIPYSRFHFKQMLRRKFDEWMRNGTIHITRFH